MAETQKTGTAEPLTLPADYAVEDGDGVDRLADLTGHFWRTIWEAPENADIREARADRNILTPGDLLHIPALRQAEETRATDLVHRFRRKGVPLLIRFEVRNVDGAAIADTPYRLFVGRRSYEGSTDSDGLLEAYVAPSAQTATLEVETSTAPPGGALRTLRWELQIGGLRPADALDGAQARLKNMGFYDGPIDGVASAETTAALQRFQQDFGLDETGELDAPTIDRLRAEHRS